LIFQLCIPFILRSQSSMKYFHSPYPFSLEAGGSLPELTIGYHTWGQLNADKSNVIWICHALTANSDAVDWWPGVVGDNFVIDPQKYFIVCANIIGSCYGTTGPLTKNPKTGEPYYHEFPQVTVRDIVKAHILLRKHLSIEKIFLLMGGSLGGYQALEWAVTEKEAILNLFLIGTSPTESAWGIAIHTTQRLAIEADQTWKESCPTAGSHGLKVARGIGLLTYRNYAIMHEKQTDPDTSKIDNFKASSYIHYQGDKLVKRFNAYSYWILTKAMDSHNLARGRGALENVLATIAQPTLIMGITTDILCPLHEQYLLRASIPNSMLVEIDSSYGHDGFLIEHKKISLVLQKWIQRNATQLP
jgi:homoserine O-acetyltransferase